MLCLPGFGTHANTQNLPHFHAFPASTQEHSPPKCLFFMANAKLPNRPGSALTCSKPKGAEKKRTLQQRPFGQPFLRTLAHRRLISPICFAHRGPQVKSGHLRKTKTICQMVSLRFASARSTVAPICDFGHGIPLNCHQMRHPFFALAEDFWRFGSNIAR